MRDGVAAVSVGLETRDRVGGVGCLQQDDDVFVGVRLMLVMVRRVTVLMMVGLAVLMMVGGGFIMMMAGFDVMVVPVGRGSDVMVVAVVAVVLLGLAPCEVRVRDAIVGMVVVPDRLVQREVNVGPELEPGGSTKGRPWLRQSAASRRIVVSSQEKS